MNIKQLLIEYREKGGTFSDTEISKIIFTDKNSERARGLFSFLKNGRHVNLTTIHIDNLRHFFNCTHNELFAKPTKST